MATWTEALYERVLAHVLPPELHASWNRVVQRDLQTLHEAVDDVAASFAKVEEVRDAVSKLQPTAVEGSASLLGALDATMTLQNELQMKLERLDALTEDTAPMRRKKKAEKRKREDSLRAVTREGERIPAAKVAKIIPEAASQTSSSSSSSESETSESSESEAEGEDDAEGSEAAWKKVKKAKETGRKRDEEGSFGLSTSVADTLFRDLPLIYKKFATKEKSWRTAGCVVIETLFTVKEWIAVQKDDRGLIQVISVLQTVLKWCKCQSLEHKKKFRFDAYYALLKTVKEYRNYVPLSKQLNGLIIGLSALLAKITRPPAKSGCKGFTLVVKRFATMSVPTRRKRIAGAIAVFTNETPSEVSDEFARLMLPNFNIMIEWFRHDPEASEALPWYRYFVEAMRDFAERAPNGQTKLSLIRSTEKMLKFMQDKQAKRS